MSFSALAVMLLASASANTDNMAQVAPLDLRRTAAANDALPAKAEPPYTAEPVAPVTSSLSNVAVVPKTDQDSIVVTARSHAIRGDPLARVNAKSFVFTQSVDEAFVGPAAMAYKADVPEPVRDGLRNFLNNLHEPDVFLNFLLQLHPRKAAETVGRFAINSTLGGAGLFDVAKRHPFRLARRPNGFADTMGYYGVKSGAFLFLPLIGATSVRDVVGGGLDRLVLPLAIGAPFTQLAYTVPTGVISALDHRIDFDTDLNKVRRSPNNPYAARRELYLQQRQAEIDALHAKRRSGDPSPSFAAPPAGPSGLVDPTSQLKPF